MLTTIGVCVLFGKFLIWQSIPNSPITSRQIKNLAKVSRYTTSYKELKIYHK